jgi:hypothetical protein
MCPIEVFQKQHWRLDEREKDACTSVAGKIIHAHTHTQFFAYTYATYTINHITKLRFERRTEIVWRLCRCCFVTRGAVWHMCACFNQFPTAINHDVQ